MRFLTRSILGLFLLTLTAGLLVMAGSTMFNAWQTSSGDHRGPGQSRERVFTVEVQTINAGTRTPVIGTFGEIVSGRTLELRAAAGGEIVQLSDNFREGGFVRAGEILFQTDPANAQSRLAVAENELAEARADLADARRSLSLAEEEIKAAESQLGLRKRAMERQDNLRARGVGTDAAMETAELAVSSAEQSLLAKKLALNNAQARIARAETTVGRREINRDEAARVLADTTVRADFDGVLADVSAVLGRLVNANEKLGNLIDPDALEVAFRVSNDQFRALIADKEGLAEARVTVSPGDDARSFTGTIDRVSAAVGEGRTGREIFAKLGETSMLTVRPGDFVTVLVEEPPLDNVVLIPATAASTIGEVLVLGEDDRLFDARVDILRKQGDNLLVRATELEGQRIVLARAPQLGAGIKVQPRARGGLKIEERKMIRLAPERRDRLIASIEANTFIPADRKAKIVENLGKEEVPEDMVNQIEARMASAETIAPHTDGETVDVPEDQRKRMIAFIEANDRIPAERKTQILETLKQDRLPRAMVERITQRMGG